MRGCLKFECGFLVFTPREKQGMLFWSWLEPGFATEVLRPLTEINMYTSPYYPNQATHTSWTVTNSLLRAFLATAYTSYYFFLFGGSKIQFFKDTSELSVGSSSFRDSCLLRCLPRVPFFFTRPFFCRVQFLSSSLHMSYR